MGREDIDGKELCISFMFQLSQYRIIVQPQVMLVVIKQGLAHFECIFTIYDGDGDTKRCTS